MATVLVLALISTVVEMGVRSVFRLPVCDQGRKLSFLPTTRRLREEQRGHATLSGSLSAICSFLLFSIMDREVIAMPAPLERIRPFLDATG
jgi:hypothetical protein